MLIGHYTNQTTFLEHILPTRKIRFSALIKTNDPEEYKTPSAYPVFDKIICSEQALAINDAVKEEFKICWEKKVKITCFSTAADNNTPCWQKPRMWAQYGNNHQGVCLLFDRQRLDDIAKKNLDLLFSGHVFYGNDSHVSDLLSPEIQENIPDIKKFIREHIKGYGDLHLLRKHPDWRSEDELRLVIFDESDPDFAYLDVWDAVDSVVLGVKFPSIYEEIVKTRMEKPVYRLHYNADNRTFCREPFA